jgi:hypothetical protein
MTARYKIASQIAGYHDINEIIDNIIEARCESAERIIGVMH